MDPELPPEARGSRTREVASDRRSPNGGASDEISWSPSMRDGFRPRPPFDRASASEALRKAILGADGDLPHTLVRTRYGLYTLGLLARVAGGEPDPGEDGWDRLEEREKGVSPRPSLVRDLREALIDLDLSGDYGTVLEVVEAARRLCDALPISTENED